MSGQAMFWGNPTVAGLINRMTVAVTRANADLRGLWESSAKTARPKPLYYSFSFFDNSNQITFGEDREYDSLASAIAHSRELLAFGDYEKIEVWVECARRPREERRRGRRLTTRVKNPEPRFGFLEIHLKRNIGPRLERL